MLSKPYPGSTPCNSTVSPKVDLLKSLLEIYTEAQLWSLVRKSTEAGMSCQDGQADVTIRFKNGHPRFVGVQTWEAEK